jgi:hypothetical protein
MLNWDDVLSTKPDVVTRATDDELVVVLPEQGKFIVLNATGAHVLTLSDGTRTLCEIAVAVAETFGADQERVKGDVLRFATMLLERGVLFVAQHGVNQAQVV